MTPEVQLEYNAAMTHAIVQYGEVVPYVGQPGGWLTSPISKHLRNCGLHSSSTPGEETWQEFDSTLDPDDGWQHGVSISNVYCGCGHIRDARVRWSATPSEMIEELFQIAADRRKG